MRIFIAATAVVLLGYGACSALSAAFWCFMLLGKSSGSAKWLLLRISENAAGAAGQALADVARSRPEDLNPSRMDFILSPGCRSRFPMKPSCRESAF